MRFILFLLLTGFLIAGCKADDESSESGEVANENSDEKTLCLCEQVDEVSRTNYAFVVNGNNCCKSKVAKDYKAVGKSFKRNGSVWELLSNKAYEPAEAQKLGCDLENMTDKKITITESNTDFVNAVLKVPTEADINPDDY